MGIEELNGEIRNCVRCMLPGCRHPKQDEIVTCSVYYKKMQVQYSINMVSMCGRLASTERIIT